VWNLDSNGNYITNSVLPSSGSSIAIENVETSFHQDLNGDSTIGIPAGTTVIQTDTNSFGSTSLVQVGSNYFLENPSGGASPELKYQGSPVVAGEFTAAGGGTWTLIGAAQTASGYEVAWKVAGGDLYTVWNVDSNGNYITNSVLPSSGSSTAIENAETSFHQDLNGDGVIGVPSGVQPKSSPIAQAAAVTVANNDTFVFPLSSGAAVANAGSSTIGEAENMFREQSAFFHESGPTHAAFVWGANEGHEAAFNFVNHESIAQSGVHLADLHAGFILVH